MGNRIRRRVNSSSSPPFSNLMFFGSWIVNSDFNLVLKSRATVTINPIKSILRPFFPRGVGVGLRIDLELIHKDHNHPGEVNRGKKCSFFYNRKATATTLPKLSFCF